MKALTLYQPWATLVAAGIKTIETRSWRTSYRGPLAIHAAAREPKAGEVVAGGVVSSHRIEYHDRVDEGWHWRAWGDDQPLHRLPVGAIVAVCRLVDCVPVVEPRTHDYTGPHLRQDSDGLHFYNFGTGRCMAVDDQRPYGDFTPGRFGWLLEDIRPLPRPVPWRGRQQLWDWPIDEETLWHDLAS